MPNTQKKSKTVDDYLSEVSYSWLNSKEYVPTKFALSFMNFIKLVNGGQGEESKTPPMHLKMLDTVANRKRDHLVNLVFRGGAKSTLFGEYFFLYLAVFHELPGLKDVQLGMYVADSMENGAKSLRRNMEYRYYASPFLMDVLPYAKFTDTEIEFKNSDGKPFNLRLFGATTGLRGTKRYGKRPQIVVADDLISDEAAKSKVVMTLIKDTIYNGIEHALDPKKRLFIFNGTPFNSEDPIIEAVESGAWEVNVYPICERFPCELNEFNGAWEDRFDYNYINNQYQLLKTTGHVNSFYQELMLQISADDMRLVRDEDIRWFSVKTLLKNKSNFNFYITTDFATSTKNSADWSVISVWAVNSNGDFFWVDGICSKQAMDKNVDDLFSLVQKYRPIMEVGVETTGQQGAFISWLSKEMMERNIWFNFATSDSKSRVPGIRPVADKLTRFNVVLPWFKAGKMYFPEELRDGTAMTELLQELRLTTYDGIKGHDDFIDTISQLAYLKIIKPSEDTEINATISDEDNRVWMFGSQKEEASSLDSYLA